MSRLRFKLEATAPDSRARAGVFHALHGEVKTPVFMPVGTQATVKSQTVDSLRTAGSRVLLANTYHLLLRPGPEVFKKFGGIHRFMNWDGPVLTDSGGFQIFSLPHSRRMDEEGARFQSYVDGRTHLLSPEASIGMQRAIGSDIMMVLDQCIPSTAGLEEARAAMELTHRWARRSLDAREDSPQSLFGIVQGACFPELRRESVKRLGELGFDGYAIGGLAVGETRDQREDLTESTAALLPQDLPRYLMGVGTPLDILEAVHRGVDMFDCILPSSLAQRGVAFTSRGKLQLRRGAYKFSEDRLDPDCECATCASYSRAYLHHLYKAEELLGWKLLTSHNLTFYHRLMREIRQSVLDGRFTELYRERRERLASSDQENPITPPKPGRARGSKPVRLGDYEIHVSREGFSTLRQLSSSEVMHPVNDPSVEAERLYVGQARLGERLAHASGNPLVLWDVGLGPATNSMAAIRCFEAAWLANPAAVRPLRIVSFEQDLDPLALALKHPGRFPHLRHAAPGLLLGNGSWKHASGMLTWELLKGDFLALLDSAPAPDLIFYDMFSARSCAEHWTPALFARIHRRCEGRSVELFTYSASTAFRAALLSAGFFVASGASTWQKSETTVAFSALNPAPHSLLGESWLKKWERSQAKFPAGLPLEARAAFEATILGHPQFANSALT
jgi:queuine tRNA-ribosyltransferase